MFPHSGGMGACHTTDFCPSHSQLSRPTSWRQMHSASTCKQKQSFSDLRGNRGLQFLWALLRETQRDRIQPQSGIQEGFQNCLFETCSGDGTYEATTCAHTTEWWPHLSRRGKTYKVNSPSRHMLPTEKLLLSPCWSTFVEMCNKHRKTIFINTFNILAESSKPRIASPHTEIAFFNDFNVFVKRRQATDCEPAQRNTA